MPILSARDIIKIAQCLDQANTLIATAREILSNSTQEPETAREPEPIEPEPVEEIEQEMTNELEPAGMTPENETEEIEPEPVQTKEVSCQELVKDTGFYASFDNWKTLYNALKFTMQAINKRSTLPITCNVCMVGRLDKVTFTTTDLEVGIELTIQSDSSACQGIITLASGPLCEMLKAIKPASIIIKSSSETSASVILDGEEQILPAIAGEEFPFPSINQNTWDKVFSLDSGELKELQTITAPAVLPFASTDRNARPELAGILTIVGESNIFLISTDGSRLAHAVQSASEIRKPGEYLIPTHTLKILQSAKSEVLDVFTEGERIYFQGDNFTIVSRLIQSRFPNWKVVIPKLEDVKYEFALSTESMSRALACLKPATKDNKRIECELFVDGITLKAGNADSGIISQHLLSKIQVATLPEDPIIFGINHAFLSDVIASAPCNGTIRMQYTGDMRPVLFKAPGDDTVDGYYSIVMPLRDR